MIVIEGPDASGKSTLARYLAHVLDAPLSPGEGPPRFTGDIPDRIKRYAELPANTIFDRHPAISDDIYSRTFYRDTELTAEHMASFYATKPIIIYCDPIPGVEHHVKPHDTPEHLKQMREYHDDLIMLYRKWALERANIVYRIGDDMDRVAHQVSPNFVSDIADFHRRFELRYSDAPRALPEDLHAFRLKFLAEELCEYAGVSETCKQLIQSALISEAKPIPLADQFDALIDLVYIALGNAYVHGFPFNAGWARVHSANMKKVRVKRADDSARNSVYDVIKPAGWQPPRLESLVEQSLFK